MLVDSAFFVLGMFMLRLSSVFLSQWPEGMYCSSRWLDAVATLCK